jgi:hypothetical protein
MFFRNRRSYGPLCVKCGAKSGQKVDFLGSKISKIFRKSQKNRKNEVF